MAAQKKTVHGEEFLNVVLGRLWPYLERYLNEDKIKDEVLKATKGYITLNSIKLGNPMTFLEASIPAQPWLVKDESDPLIFDFDTEFKNVEVSLSDTKVGISFGVVISFKCNLRVQLQQLTSEFLPLFEVLTLFMTEQPEMHLDFTGAADVLDIPLLTSGKPEHIAIFIMNSVLVYPNRLTLPMKEHVDISRQKSPLPIGLLMMQVIKIENLTDTHEFWGMPEFYYKVVSSHSGEFTSKTRTAEDADKGNTDWNETVALVVYEPDLESLEIRVYEDDTMGNDLVGRVTFGNLSNLIFPSLTMNKSYSDQCSNAKKEVTEKQQQQQQPKPFQSVFDLQGDKTGKATILFEFQPLSSNVTGFCEKTLASEKLNGKIAELQFYLKVYITNIVPLASEKEGNAAADTNKEHALKDFYFECVENQLGGVVRQKTATKSYSTCKKGFFSAPMDTEVFLNGMPEHLNFVLAADRNELKNSAIAQFKISPLSSSVAEKSSGSRKDSGDKVTSRFEDEMKFEVDVDKVGTITVLIHSRKLSMN